MLSAVIHSRHSYPALPRAGQLVDQRSVLSGPLVTYSIISNRVDYIFTPPWRGSACYGSQCPIQRELHCHLHSGNAGIPVVTGSNPTMQKFLLLFSFFLWHSSRFVLPKDNQPTVLCLFLLAVLQIFS